jgi:hypothetical protein
LLGNREDGFTVDGVVEDDIQIDEDEDLDGI